jgi:tetratricopeptide (TPR) repeat protein
MKKVWWIAIGVGVLFFVVVAGVSLLGVLEIATEFPKSSVHKPMYGYSSYEEYLNGISPNLKEEREEWVANFDEMGINNASKYFTLKGWQSLSNDPDFLSAMQHFNSAWLLDNDNFNIYWGFGATLGGQYLVTEDVSDIEMSLKMFEKSLELYKEEDENHPQDRFTLSCDFARSYILRATEEELFYLDSALELTTEALDSIPSEEPHLASKALCAYTEAEVWYWKEDYEKSWEKMNIALELAPEGFYDNNPLIEVLSKEMPNPNS